MDNDIKLTNISKIENVDYAIYDWLDKELNLFCNSKDGFKKVPIIWVTPERAFQVKQNKEFRDVGGTLNPPMLTVERGAINKDQKNAATYYANLPPKNNRLLISKRINQQKTSEFANADFKKRGVVNFLKPKTTNKVVYQFDSFPLPVYVNITYTLKVFTQFQQQMNEIIQPFLNRTGNTRYFLVERDGYKYECFIEPNFDVQNNVANMEEEERRYLTTITIKVLANIVSDDVNQNDSLIKTYENPVEIKLPKDNVTIVDQITNLEPKKQPPANAASQTYSNVAIKKVFLIGNGMDSVYYVFHGLNTRDLYVAVRENFAPYSPVLAGIDNAELDHIDIDMHEIIGNDTYVVTIIG